jgi:hypothetical protein
MFTVMMGSADRAALRKKIEALKPSFLAFTSKNAGKQFLGGARFCWGGSPRIGTTRLRCPLQVGRTRNKFNIMVTVDRAAAARPLDSRKTLVV